MMPFGIWNPKGTSNSEYGKFAYQNSLHGPTHSPSMSNMHSGAGWSFQQQGQQGAFQPGHQHLPGCHNYQSSGQNQGQGGHQHHATCPNGLGQGGDNSPQYTIEYGHEAAAAAMGGKPEFNMAFSMAQANQSQPGAAQGLQQYSSQQDQEVHSCSSEAMMMAEKSQRQGMEMQSGGGGNIEPVETSAPPKPEVTENPTATAGQENDGNKPENQAQGDTSATPSPSTKKPVVQQQLPTKWRGLPRTGKNPVRFGRQGQGRDASPSPSFTGSEGMVTMPPNLQAPSGGMMATGDYGHAGGMPETEMGYSKMGRLLPRGARQSASMTVNHGIAPMSKPKASAPSLCGKCPKCKIYIPPSEGPSSMVFPTRSRNQRVPNVRSMHNMGTQDAKNFRAAQYFPRHHRE